MVLWLDFVIFMCYVCSLFCTLLSLSLSWFMYIDVSNLSLDSFCCQPLRSSTPAPPHSTILPLAHFPEVTQLTVYPLVWLSQREASPSSHSLTLWWLTSQGSFTRLPLLTWRSHSWQFHPTLSFPESPSQSEAVSCWGQPQPVSTQLVIVDVLLILIDLQIKCCGERLDLIIDYLFNDETFVFFSLFFVCLFVYLFVLSFTSVLSVSVMCVSHCMSVFVTPLSLSLYVLCPTISFSLSISLLWLILLPTI